MKNYDARLNEIKKDYKNQNINIDDITTLYADFIQNIYTNRFNYIWREKARNELDKQYQKRAKKEDFNKNLFSKIIFNWLYNIRMNKNDIVYSFWNKESTIYKYNASHQYTRHELEKMSIDQIIYLSYKLSNTFKLHK